MDSHEIISRLSNDELYDIALSLNMPAVTDDALLRQVASRVFNVPTNETTIVQMLSFAPVIALELAYRLMVHRASTIIHLQPVSYSKTHTMDEVLKNLLAYPEQGTNTEQAFKYSMEFVEYQKPESPVGTLSEYVAETPGCVIFVLHLKDGNVLVRSRDKQFLGTRW